MKVIEAINKKFGDRAAFWMSDETADRVYVIPTGSFNLDMALGVGGVPRGRITEIYGPESSGKTTLCQHIVAEAQKMGGVVAYVDVEYSLDPYWLETTGVDDSNLIVSQPDTGEQAMDIVELYVKSKEIDLVVVDSVAALAPKAELEGEMGDAHVALKARLMSQAMRKLTAAISESNTALIFTNQLRDKVGGMSWGPTEDTPGGKALRYAAAVRIDLRKTEQVKDKDEVVGNNVKATIRKNKVAAPFKVTNFTIQYNTGIDIITELISYGTDMGLIEKSGAWFKLEGETIQGLQNLRNRIKEDLTLRMNLENKIRASLNLPLIGI